MTKYDYAVIESESKPKLEKEVIRVLQMGYRLAGGIAVTESNDQPILYYQALIKEYEEED